MPALMELMRITHAGVTTDEFDAAVHPPAV
jgi:hypothetical protein